ncbi:MAG: putative cytochrome [Frankiales bacterium]|nr:putative cytochrome [Frankiales bacterium]
MTTSQRDLGSCPVLPYLLSPPQAPALTYFERNDGFQSQARPALWTDEGPGYWVFTDREVILDGLQQHELFSSAVIVPTEPDPPYKWIPIMLDPPEHTLWRRLLGRYFSPKRVLDMEADQRGFANSLIDAFEQRGECEFIADFAQVFPTTIFLQIMGMPREQLDEFMEWEHAMLHTTQEDDPDGSRRLDGMVKVQTYFAGLIAQRRAAHDPEAQDIVSHALTWEVNGAPVTDADMLSCLLLLFMAGLDTVAAQLSYIFRHLAAHPEDRRRIVADPTLIPHAVEELLRAFPIVQTARKATRDADFHGCPIKTGDMAVFPLSMAGRDDQAFPEAKRVDFDREDVRHLSFGAGPHRCLGSHLARQELVVVLEEWHKRIPDYEIVGEPREHAGGVFGLDTMALRWTR